MFGGWRDGSVSKVLGLQAWGVKFDTLSSRENAGRAVQAVGPTAVERQADPGLAS